MPPSGSTTPAKVIVVFSLSNNRIVAAHLQDQVEHLQVLLRHAGITETFLDFLKRLIMGKTRGESGQENKEKLTWLVPGFPL